MKLLIGVLTAKKLKFRRQAVWDTWGKEAILLPGVDLVFVIGDPELKIPKRDGSFLYVPCPDTYKALPKKTRWLCLWTIGCTDADYLFKCDDDTYCRPDRLVTALLTDPRWEAVGGAVARRNRIDRFCFHGGAGYILHRRAMMAVGAYLTLQEGSEDYSVGAVLKENGLNVLNEGRLNFNKQYYPTPENNFITTHNLSPEQMRAMHQTFKR